MSRHPARLTPAPRPHPRTVFLRCLLPLIVLLLACTPGAPPSAALTVVAAPAFAAPGQTLHFLVRALDVDASSQGGGGLVPMAGAQFEARLTDDAGSVVASAQGETDAGGFARAAFDLPADAPASAYYQVEFSVRAASGTQVSAGAYLTADEPFDMLLTTDKPVYQPGQVIHARVLGLGRTDLRAAGGAPITFALSDPQGNQIAQVEAQASEFGVGATDFALDAQAAPGDYVLRAFGRESAFSERTVEVKPYTLPRFEILFAPDRGYFLAGETATGAVSARYFFGKPVAGGQVTLRGYVQDTFDATIRSEVFTAQGETDADGVFRFAFDVPQQVAARYANEAVDVDVEVEVTDAAGHLERVDESVTVADAPVLVEAAAEAGMLVPGVENIVYLNATYPDGSGGVFDLTVTGDALPQPVELTTDEHGLAALRVTPDPDTSFILDVAADDRQGSRATREVALFQEPGRVSLLLRPARVEVALGETLDVEVLTASDLQTVYLAVGKMGGSAFVATLPVENGVARTSLAVDGSLLGTLELTAYTGGPGGQIVSSRRLVLVNPPAAEVTVEADAAEYRPGGQAALTVAVRNGGEPMQGVVGVSIVDESVSAVAEAQPPGFARTFFLLDRELQDAPYGPQGFVEAGSGDPSPYVARSVAPPALAAGRSDASPYSARDLALSGALAQELAAAQLSAPPPACGPGSWSSCHLVILSAVAGYGSRLALAAPLLGLALYDGTRRRRRFALLLAAAGAALFVLASCAPSAAPAAAPAAEEAAPAGAAAPIGQPEPPRLRQFFPETLYWLAEGELDAEGRITLDVHIADSITTWTVGVVASDKDGNLGSAEVGLRVFQDFFVEPDLPRHLTVGDEVDVPVSVYNYLGEAQTVALTVKPAPWFELRGGAAESAVQQVTLGPNEVAAAVVPIRVTGFGAGEFEVAATTDRMGDAVLRTVEVAPAGQAQAATVNGVLRDEQEFTVSVPQDVVAGTGEVTVKLYPGLYSELADAVQGIVREPYGCFEQTTSATYPNVMALAWLRAAGAGDARVTAQAEQYTRLGYQRLLTFEVDNEPGGFSLWGDPPAQLMLTAYGLMQFNDMAQVSFVDPAVPARMADYIIARQQPDGSWDDSGLTIESAAGLEGSSGDDARLRATAWIAWALAEAGYANSPAVQGALGYLRAQMGEPAAAQPAPQPPSPLHAGQASTQGQARPGTPAPPAVNAQLPNYTLALIANAFIAAGEDPIPVLDLLIERAAGEADQTGATVHWNADTRTWTDGSGTVADVETTALVAYALQRAGYREEVAAGALNYLVENRDGQGMFMTTQATVLALKALALAETGAAQEEATVTVLLDGEQAQTITLAAGDTPEAQVAQAAQTVRFTNVPPGEHTVTIRRTGARDARLQVVTGYYLPWESVAAGAEESPLRVRLEYDRARAAVNETVNAHAAVELAGTEPVGMAVAALGIPPGFSVVEEDLDRMLDLPYVRRWERIGPSLVVYLSNLPGGTAVELDYRLTPRMAVRAQTPPAQAWDYYNPGMRGYDAPQEVVVIGD